MCTTVLVTKSHIHEDTINCRCSEYAGTERCIPLSMLAFAQVCLVRVQVALFAKLTTVGMPLLASYPAGMCDVVICMHSRNNQQVTFSTVLHLREFLLL